MALPMPGGNSRIVGGCYELVFASRKITSL
jgi:hypothetical protein